jgi:hypothetical protein
MTSKLGLSVADGVGQSAIPAGYFAYGLCYQSIMTYFNNQGPRTVHLSTNNLVFWNTLNKGLDAFMANYSTESKNYNVQATHPHTESLHPDNILSYSTFVTVYLDNKPRTKQVFLKHYQKGDSQFIVFRLLENDKGTFNYVPIYFSHDQQTDFNSSQQFGSDAFKQKRTYYDTEEIVDELEVFENDIVLLGSDGLFDNLFLSYITYLVNMIVKDMYYHHFFNLGSKQKAKYSATELVKLSLNSYIELLNGHWDAFHVKVEEIKKQQVERRSVSIDKARARALSRIDEKLREDSGDEDSEDEESEVEQGQSLQNAINKFGETNLEKIIEVDPIEEKNDSELDQDIEFAASGIYGSSKSIMQPSTEQSQYPIKDLEFKVKKIVVNKIKSEISKMFRECKVMDIINDPTFNEETEEVISLCARQHIEDTLSFDTEQVHAIAKFFNGGVLSKAIATAATAFYQDPAPKLHPMYVKAWEYQQHEDYGHLNGKPDDVTAVASIVYKVEDLKEVSALYTNKLKSFVSYNSNKMYRDLQKDILYLRKMSSAVKKII